MKVESGKEPRGTHDEQAFNTLYQDDLAADSGSVESPVEVDDETIDLPFEEV